MGMYKRILAAFDGSGSSRDALRQAIKLAGAEKAWVKVVSVVPEYMGELDLTGVQDPGKAIAGPAEKLLVEARGLAAELGASVITNIERGEAYERIVDVAESENCDLIVMGRKGHGRLEKALMGCVTERVVGYTRKDVLVVPKDRPVGWGSILVPTDGSPSGMAAARKAASLARSYGGKIIAASVVDVNDEFGALAPGLVEEMIIKARAAVDLVSSEAEKCGVACVSLVKEGDAPEVITRIAQEHGAELVVMASRGRTGLGKILMGSVTQKVIGLARCPVLIIRA